MVARTKDGKEIRGIRRAEDTFSLLITDTSGKLLRLDKWDLASVTVEQKSLMPADFAQRLSEAEIQSLVAYLRTQTARNLSADIPAGVTYDRLRNAAAEPQNWLTYWGDYQGRHYSALKQIDTTNVRELQARWAVQLPNNSLLVCGRSKTRIAGMSRRHRPQRNVLSARSTDRKLLLGKAFVRRTWNTGFDAYGRPKIVLNSDSQARGRHSGVSIGGRGTNFQAPSYSPVTGWLYLMTGDSGQRYIRTPSEYQAGKQYASGGPRGLGEPASAAIKGLDPEVVV